VEEKKRDPEKKSGRSEQAQPPAKSSEEHKDLALEKRRQESFCQRRGFPDD